MPKKNPNQLGFAGMGATPAKPKKKKKAPPPNKHLPQSPLFRNHKPHRIQTEPKPEPPPVVRPPPKIVKKERSLAELHERRKKYYFSIYGVWPPPFVRVLKDPQAWFDNPKEVPDA